MKPEGVRIKHEDGTETPVLELIPLGEIRGLDAWGVPESYHFNVHTDSLLIAVLPAKTAIEFMGSES